MHEGDAALNAASFAGLVDGATPPDLAVLHSWWVTAFEGRQATLDLLRPRSVVLMHHRWSMAAETRARIAALGAEERRALPPVLVFGDELETQSFRCSPAGSE